MLHLAAVQPRGAPMRGTSLGLLSAGLVCLLGAPGVQRVAAQRVPPQQTSAGGQLSGDELIPSPPPLTASSPRNSMYYEDRRPVSQRPPGTQPATLGTGIVSVTLP